MLRRNAIGKSSMAHSEAATVSALKATVRPAVPTVLVAATRGASGVLRSSSR